MIFFIIFFPVHMPATSLAATCNTCGIDWGFGQYCTQYTVLPKATVNSIQVYVCAQACLGYGVPAARVKLAANYFSQNVRKTSETLRFFWVFFEIPGIMKFTTNLVHASSFMPCAYVWLSTKLALMFVYGV